MKKINTNIIKSINDNPLFDDRIDPGVPKKIFVYGTLGLLWGATIFGLLFLPMMISLSSTHSYFSESVNANTWIYYYIILSIYTILASMYVGIKGFNSNFLVIGLLNTVFVTGFVLTTFMSFFILFFVA